MNELTHGEKAYCAAIADRIRRLRRHLADADLCDPPDAPRWYKFLAALKAIQGNTNNDLSFIATLLAKAWLVERLPIPMFDAAGKAQGAGGFDVDLKTADGNRIVAEIKNTVPYKPTDFGAAQKREFRKDFTKLNAAVAHRKFLFVTDRRAFALLRKKYAPQIPGVDLVLLGAANANYPAAGGGRRATSSSRSGGGGRRPLNRRPLAGT